MGRASSGCERLTITALCDPERAAAATIRELRESLSRRPREIPSKYFYDERGGLLFEEITTLPEYYLTRAETAILERHAERLVGEAAPVEIVELGAGYSRKTRLLLDAAGGRHGDLRLAALDVTREALIAAGQALTATRPWLRFDGYLGDFEHDIGRIPRQGRRLLVFLGSTVGNLYPEARRRFFGEVRRALTEDDTFLLGVDLVKDRGVLEAAYDDSRGVTAAFNLNALSVINARLAGDFDPEGFEHVARFDPHGSWIEMRLRARLPMRVRLAAADLSFTLEAGEEIRTEISTKFTRATIAEDLASAGLALTGWQTDGQRRFALAISRRAC